MNIEHIRWEWSQLLSGGNECDLKRGALGPWLQALQCVGERSDRSAPPHNTTASLSHTASTPYFTASKSCHTNSTTILNKFFSLISANTSKAQSHKNNLKPDTTRAQVIYHFFLVKIKVHHFDYIFRNKRIYCHMRR